MSYIRTGFGRFRYMYRLLMPQSNLQRVAGSATSKEEQKKRAAGATLRHISNFLYPGMAYPGKCDDPIHDFPPAGEAGGKIINEFIMIDPITGR